MGSTARSGWNSSLNPKTAYLDTASGKKTLTLAGAHGGELLGDFSTSDPSG